MHRILCVEEDTNFRSMIAQISFEEGYETLVLNGLQFHEIFVDANDRTHLEDKDWQILIIDHTLIRADSWHTALQSRPWTVVLTSWLTTSDIDQIKNIPQIFSIFHSHKFGSFYEAKSELSFLLSRAIAVVPQISNYSFYNPPQLAPTTKKRKSKDGLDKMQSSEERISEEIGKWSQIATTLLYDVTGEDFFEQAVKSVARFLGAKHVMIGELHGEEVSVVAYACDSAIVPTFSYDVKGTPCDEVFMKKALCTFNGDALEKFPLDSMMQDMHINTYIGTPLFSSDRRPIGIFTICNDKTFADLPYAETLLKLLSSRAAAEMERLMTINKLKCHIQVESQMVYLSNYFTKKFNDDNDSCLTLALKTFGGLLHSSRAYIYRLKKDAQGGWLQADQEWNNEGVEHLDSDLRHIRLDHYPYCLPSAEDKKAMFVQMTSDGFHRTQKLSTAAQKQLKDLVEILFVPISEFGEVAGYLVFDFQHVPGCVVTSNFDILILLAEMIAAFEERRTFHERLVKSKELAEVGDRAKSEFLSIISHELRTPLTGILGNLTLLRDSQLTHDQTEQLGMIRSCSEALLYLINDLIDFSQIDSGRLLIANHPFNIRECLTASVEIWKSVAQKKGLKFDLYFDDRVPTTLIGDSVRLGQILSQLCNNAVKFTAQGGIGVYCRVQALSSVKQTCTLRIDVQDSGIGIEGQNIPKLFTKPFYQLAPCETRRSGGLGIGLMICSRLLACMNGEIHASSPGKGRGSTFSVTLELPIGPGSEISSLQQVPVCKPAESKNEEPAKTFSVLVVDDNSVNQVIVSRFIKKLGVPGTVITLADDGEQALQKISNASYPFDLIILDLMMPGIDGFEVFSRLLHMCPDAQTRPKVVAITANASEAVKQKCLSAGMNDFMTKPLMFDKFKGRLDQLHIYDLPKTS